MIFYYMDEAVRIYEKACRQGLIGKIWSILTGHPGHLLDLEAVRRTVKICNRHYAGLHSVPIQDIRGSEGHSREFDTHFRPLQTHTQYRWLSIAMAYKLDQGLPAVELIKVGDIYFVRDGHHRISVAYNFGQSHIDAEVTVWETAAVAACCELVPCSESMPK